MLDLLSGLLIALADPAGFATGPIPGVSRQLVVVVTPDWSSTVGSLMRFERADSAHAWMAVGEPVDVVVGRAGLGWGRGLHAGVLPGPRKAEGDGRAPAGAFLLAEAFGYAPSDSATTGLDYLHATPDLECVDDGSSSFYNRVLDKRTVSPDWTSHEEMRRRDVLYRRGVIVAHNAGPIVQGGGSCIFLHVWRGPGSTTSGCTAMAEPALAESMRWLDAAATPVLVQLPTREYRRLRRAWSLPRMTAR